MPYPGMFVSKRAFFTIFALSAIGALSLTAALIYAAYRLGLHLHWR